jgi:hypothetical protein
VAIDP